MSVLIVQPDSSAADSLLRQLSRYGYDTRVVGTGTSALNAYQEAELILLDLELPDLDGLEVCRTIRKTGDIPIIMLTPGDTELDTVLCLHAGADNCLVKPYGLHELLARMQAVLRRVRKTACSPQGTLVNGSLLIRPQHPAGPGIRTGPVVDPQRV